MVTDEATILACSGEKVSMLQVMAKTIILIRQAYEDCIYEWMPPPSSQESTHSDMQITHASSATGGKDGGGVLGVAIHHGRVYNVYTLVWGSSGIQDLGEMEINYKVEI